MRIMHNALRIAYGRMFFVAFALLFCCSGTAVAKKRPDWVDGSSKKYPESAYFMGVGGVSMDKGGKNQQLRWAADRARAEIAKTIKVDVEVKEREERLLERKSGTRKPESVTKRSDVIVARASQVLEGVEVKQYYTDKRARMIYALAVLDRMKTARRIKGDIEKLQRSVLTEMEVGQDAIANPLVSFGHYQDAMIAAEKINELNRLLSVVHPSGRGMDDMNYVPEINVLLYQIKKKIKFIVKVSGPASSVRHYIARGLTKDGFSVGSSEETGKRTYILEGVTDLNYRGELEVSSKLRVRIYQADLTLELGDPVKDEVLAAYVWSVSANEKTEGAAKKSAIKALGETVERQIVSKIF